MSSCPSAGEGAVTRASVPALRRGTMLRCRRWLNGTTSGYLWLIFSPRLWASCGSGTMAFKIFFMALLQLLVFGIVFISSCFLVGPCAS